MTHSAPGDPRAPRIEPPRAPPRPRAELRRRPEHGAPHRRPGPGRPDGSRRRDRRRPRIADARARRHRCRRSPPSRSTAGSCRCCARSWPTAPNVDRRRSRRDGDRLERDCSPGDRRGWVLVANLPYNVATPLVCDLLDDVPQIRRMIVMVQREVAERFAAQPRTSAYGAVSVKVAYWATARIVGHVPATVFVPRPERRVVARRDHPPRRTPPRPVDRPGRCCSRSSGPGSASGARCCAGRSTASSPPSSSRRPGSRRRARPRSSTSSRGAAWPTPSTATHRAGHAVSTWRAHAKLTLSLHVTGVRDDGYHLIDAEMVSLELHDLLDVRTIDATGDELDRDRSVRRRDADSTARTSSRGARPRRARRRTSRSTSASRTAAGSVADRPTPRRCCAGPASARSADELARAGRLGADIPFCLVGGRARVRASVRSSTRSPTSPARHARHPAAAGRARRPSTGRGTNSATDRPRRRPQRPRGRGARRRTRSSRAGATGSRDAIGDRADAGRQRRDVVRRRRHVSRGPGPTSRRAGATMLVTAHGRRRTRHRSRHVTGTGEATNVRNRDGATYDAGGACAAASSCASSSACACDAS